MDVVEVDGDVSELEELEGGERLVEDAGAAAIAVCIVIGDTNQVATFETLEFFRKHEGFFFRELTEEKALVLSKKLEGLKRGDLVRVTYYDTYGYRSRTGILDEALPAFKLLKLRDIAIDFDDIQDIELRGRA